MRTWLLMAVTLVGGCSGGVGPVFPEATLTPIDCPAEVDGGEGPICLRLAAAAEGGAPFAVDGACQVEPASGGIYLRSEIPGVGAGESFEWVIAVPNDF